MTEDEAKNKWCPFVRHVDGHSTAASNRFGFTDDGDADVDAFNSCIGSQCMAWRTENYIDDNRMPDVRGYCGLAGKP